MSSNAVPTQFAEDKQRKCIVLRSGGWSGGGGGGVRSSGVVRAASRRGAGRRSPARPIAAEGQGCPRAIEILRRPTSTAATKEKVTVQTWIECEDV